MPYARSLILLACCLGGCAQLLPPPTRQQIEAGPLAFLVDGKTSREDILLRIGTPSGQFESDRVLTFRLAISRKLQLMPASRVAINYQHDDEGVWIGSTHDLVIVFDENNIAQKHSLILVREPPP